MSELKKKRKKKSMIWKISSEQFKNIVSNSRTLKEVLEHFGRSNHSRGSYKTLKERIEFENVDISHMEAERLKIRIETLKKVHTIPLSEVLVENSTYQNRAYLKFRLLTEGLLEGKCYKCGIGNEWQGEPLSLQLDHINGIHNDNRLVNLRLLCPNCHSQTSTFSGKVTNKKILNCTKCQKQISKQNKSGYCIKCHNQVFDKSILQRTVNRPSKEKLLELILVKPFLQIAKDYGVSDNAIRKWCKYYDLPYRKKDIEEFKKKQLLINI